MIIQFVFAIIGVYLICGFVFAVAFVFKGAREIDEGAKGSSAGFKIIIIPASMVFWPFLLIKWIKAPKN
jgi:hypothetical protein